MIILCNLLSDMEQVITCTGSSQTCNQTILEHIGAAAGVLTNDDAGGLVVAVALTQCVIIPAKEAANLISLVGSQINTSFTTKAVCSRVFPNYFPLLLKKHKNEEVFSLTALYPSIIIGSLRIHKIM